MNELRPLAIDLALSVAVLLVFVIDLILPPGRKRMLGGLTAAMLGGLFVLSFFLEPSGTALHGAYVGSAWTAFFKRIALAAGSLMALGAVDHVDRHFPERQGEFWALMLFVLLGMTLLPGARDLILLVVCFELMGLPLAALAAFAKTDDKEGPGKYAAEAGLKLYLVSAASTAITLFGLSLVYGLSGTTKIVEIAAAPASPLLLVGMFFSFAGMSFKLGLVPFHMWIPDTYQGAPTPFVSFLSVAPKATGFAALTILFMLGFQPHRARWFPVMLAMVVISILVGNLLALPQKDLKRLLAYSGIAHVGYMLIGLVTGSAYGTGMLLFYVAGYVVTNMGMFLVLEAVAPNKPTITLADVSGLASRSPLLALAMLLFLLSLAGIPFVVGFWAKLYVFMAAYQAGLGWLVLFGALMAIVALFYYLQVARAAYMSPPETDEPLRVDGSLEGAVLVCLLLVVMMGAYPKPFVDLAMAASHALIG